MLTVALALLALLGPGTLPADHDADPYGPEPPFDTPAVLPEPPFDTPAVPGDPCDGRRGWVGDGEDGRDAPACDGPDADLDDDPASLHEPDWLRSGETWDDGER